jgi:hypothetical protein
MKAKINIMCLYWVGDFRERDFTPTDVWTLQQNVDRYIDRPYDFYVLTNDMTADLPGIKIPLDHNWEGWWSKMELYRLDLPKGRTLYMDLDSHIVGSLQQILDYKGDLVMFNTPAKYRKIIRNTDKTIIYRYQAATILFNPGSQKEMYMRFCQNPEHWMAKYRSDQDILGLWYPDLPTFPDEWMLKLADAKKVDKKPKDCIIVTGRIKDGRFRKLEECVWLQDAIEKGVTI